MRPTDKLIANLDASIARREIKQRQSLARMDARANEALRRYDERLVQWGVNADRRAKPGQPEQFAPTPDLASCVKFALETSGDLNNRRRDMALAIRRLTRWDFA